MFLIFAFFSFVLSLLFFSNGGAIVFLAGTQLILLVGMIRQRNLTGTGAFIFMSFLFFGIRPLYVWLEKDYSLFQQLFRVPTNIAVRNEAMWWATAAIICFYLGALLARKLHASRWRTRLLKAQIQTPLPLVSNAFLGFLIFLQVLSLLFMLKLGASGRSLYGSGMGAYLYDLPVLLQSGHIFTLILILERWLNKRSIGLLFLLGLSGLLFLIFTWEMRNVSMFRGFYLTGLMIAGIAALARLKPRVGYAWLIIPIIGILPYFRTLGETRYAQNDQLTELVSEETSKKDKKGLVAYWRFFDSEGDMNIFDTFVAAKASTPAFRPYLMSWLYVPVHIVPRAIWTSKPKQGILVDVRFMREAPYSPGIAGFFLLDGGLLWMLGCMAVLGYLIGRIDWEILTMPHGYLRCCFYGIIVINAMFLTRFFLWQSFYQVLYAIIPCLVLNALVQKKKIRPQSRKNSELVTA